MVWSGARAQSPAQPKAPAAQANPPGQQSAEPKAVATPAPAVSAEAARHAQSSFDAGRAAEAEGRWHLAYSHYAEAARVNPAKNEYGVARELAKFRIAQQHVDRGEAAAVNGNLEQAILELRAAVALDSSYGVARERLRQLQAIASRDVRIRTEQDGGTAKLRPAAGTRSFNVRGNTRTAYEEIARQFSLSATFDDGIRQRTLHFRLPEVDAQTALDLLATQSSTYWMPIGERSFFVTDNTEQRRREYEPSVVTTVTLPATTTTEGMTELVRILRDVFDIRRVQLDVRSRTIILRDSPETIALATALLEELEQPRGELMLEVTVAEVDRAKALRLGVLPPSSARLFTISPQDLQQLQGPQQSFGDLAALLQRIFGTSGGGGLGGLVPPLVAFGGGQTVGLATLPGASAEFQQAMSVFHSARRVLLRSQDGQPASFFIGERYPINLSVLSDGIGQGIGLPGTDGSGIIPRQDFAAGDGPSSITAFDVNEDGLLDLVVANQAANTVSILLGNSNGSFGAPADFAVGLAPASVAVGDFNADGDLDVVTANEGDDSITVLFGNGDGTFGAPNAFPVGILPRAVVAANLNGDGNVDLIVANHGSNTISVLLGNPAGTFNVRTDFNVGAGPIALALSDYDRDGLLDVAVANQNSNDIFVLFGAGDGTFTSFSGFVTGTAPRALIAANLNNDANVDIVIANEGSDTVSIFLGNGDGTFLAAEFFTGPSPRAVFAADFDGDGRVDVITANNANDTISLLLGIGDGTLGLRADLAVGDGPVAMAAGNFNVDGRLDLATANQSSDNVTVILNTPTGVLPDVLQPTTPYPAFQFEELGLKVRATPRMHSGYEVTLQLNIEIRSRSSETFNGLPVITNRTLEESVRLKEDETTVIAGILQRDEALSLTGTPGLSHLLLGGGGPGRAVSKRDTDSGETELILLVTPRRLRLAPRVQRTLVTRPDAGAARRPVTSN